MKQQQLFPKKGKQVVRNRTSILQSEYSRLMAAKSLADISTACKMNIEYTLFYGINKTQVF